MSVQLLDRESIFEVYQVINSLAHSLPSRRTGLRGGRQESSRNGVYSNELRTKFMMLTPEEARECRVHALGTFTSLSPSYGTGNHRLCLLELFKGVREGCQVKRLTNTVLPQAISISDVIWAIAT